MGRERPRFQLVSHVLAAVLSFGGVQNASGEECYVPGMFNVGFREGVTEEERRRLHERLGTLFIAPIQEQRVHIVGLNTQEESRNINDIFEQYKQSGLVEFAEMVSLATVPESSNNPENCGP